MYYGKFVVCPCGRHGRIVFSTNWFRGYMEGPEVLSKVEARLSLSLAKRLKLFSSYECSCIEKQIERSVLPTESIVDAEIDDLCNQFNATRLVGAESRLRALTARLN